MSARDCQPTPVPAMSIHSPRQQQVHGRAERLRGGCIPCPVCSTSLISLQNYADIRHRWAGREHLLYHSHSLLLLKTQT